ncbi:MAG: DUF881 domain-containing protein [Chloroflexota bacterium]|nr:DUF881 domain-containing protein [Chloroflexota bacterium]
MGICLGLLLQVKTHSPADLTIDSHYEQAQLQSAIQQLEREQIGLKESISHLRERLERYQRSASSETETLRELRDELGAQRMRAGLVATRGPGVVVSLDDSDIANSPPDVDLNPYIVHGYDLRDAANLLWLAGAEAVAVNDERIVASTSIYCVGSTIMVNDTRLSPPYTVRAIGDPAALYAVAMDPAYLRDLHRRVQQLGLKLAVDQRQEMVLPAFEGSFTLEYTQAGGE